MHASFRPLLVATSLLALPLPAAVTALDVEPYVFAGLGSEPDAGWSTGIACVSIVPQDCPVRASSKDGGEDSWGLGAAVRIAGPWWLDARWFEQEADVRYLDFDGTEVVYLPAEFAVDHVHLGALYRFREGRWSPFATAFGGLARVESAASTTRQSGIDFDRTTLGVGAGVLLDLSNTVGLRFEARSSWTSLPEEFEGDLDRWEGTAALRLRL